MQNIYIVEFTRLLQVVILVAGGARIVYCLTVMHMDGSDETSYRKRIRNVLVFIVIAELFGSTINTLASYFS